MLYPGSSGGGNDTTSGYGGGYGGAGDGSTPAVNLVQSGCRCGRPVGYRDDRSFRAGSTSASFTVTTSSTVTTETTATITATNGVETASGTIAIDPSRVGFKGLALLPTAVVVGQIDVGVVSLTGLAPAGGVVISLSSSNPALAPVPAFIKIPVGRSSTSIGIPTLPVNATTSVKITATLGSVTKTATLTVSLTGVSSLVIIPNSVMGGLETAQGIVTLQDVVSTDTIVTLKSNTAAAILPQTTVVIPAGSVTTTFDIVTSAVSHITNATITATANKVGKSATLTVN